MNDKKTNNFNIDLRLINAIEEYKLDYMIAHDYSLWVYTS